MSVIVSNISGHQTDQTALALQEAGMLKRYYASNYYVPHRWPFLLADKLASLGLLRSTRFHSALSRHNDLLQDKYVEILQAPLYLRNGLTPLVRRLRSLESSPYYWSESLFDLQVSKRLPDCAAVHCVERCALYTMRTAKRRGITTVLDSPTPHIDFKVAIGKSESDRCGIRQHSPSIGYQHHIDRKLEEYALADHIVCGLHFDKSTFVKKGIDPNKIFTNLWGADVASRFRPVARKTKSGLHILHVGHLHWFKGLHYLLDALTIASDPSIHLTVIGSPRGAWGEYFLRRFSEFDGRITYIPRVSYDQIAECYHKADVFVFPSLIGGIGLSVCEAMSTGLPVIVTDGDEVVRNEIEGLVVPQRDTERLADAIHILARNPDLVRSMGAAAANRSQEFGWSRYRRRTAEIYRELLH